LAQDKPVLGRRDLEELHLAPHVVQRGYEQVHGPVHGMELRVLRLGQPNLRQQLSHEAYVAPRVVCVLHQPLRQRTRRQRTAPRMREERLLRGLYERT
jgi:hypothetical protein